MLLTSECQHLEGLLAAAGVLQQHGRGRVGLEGGADREEECRDASQAQGQAPAPAVILQACTTRCARVTKLRMYADVCNPW